MIIYHQTNVAAFVGNHVVYWIGQPIYYRISAPTADAVLPTRTLMFVGT